VNNCNEYIEKIYLHPAIEELIGKIKPIEIQDDLRQELAIALYEYDCNKLIEMSNRNELIYFALRIVLNMAKGTSNDFYRKFRKQLSDDQLQEYLTKNHAINFRSVDIAQKLLDKKLTENSISAHESIIFSKYVELGSMGEVAKFYSIPKAHIFQVITNIKKQLKNQINESI